MQRPSRCTYDAAPGIAPRVGDALVTTRGVRYRIATARRVRSRVSPSRWALTMVRGEGPLPGGRWLSLRWYPRGRRRAPCGKYRNPIWLRCR